MHPMMCQYIEKHEYTIWYELKNATDLRAYLCIGFSIQQKQRFRHSRRIPALWSERPLPEMGENYI